MKLCPFWDVRERKCLLTGGTCEILETSFVLTYNYWENCRIFQRQADKVMLNWWKNKEGQNHGGEP